MPIVVIERGNDKGKSLQVEPGQRYVVGRDPAAGIVLSDPLSSRRHFEIFSDGKAYRIRDLQSTNGTFLNDEKLDERELKVGDKVQVGETILSFLSDQREETAQGLVGKTIGGYKLLERVGRGGMGTVYKANQLSLNRIVAFKVLSARLLRDEKFIEKFKSEARAAGALNHPNIVGVYDVGTDREIHFFSMEYMDGGSVQDLIGKDQKLGWEEALDVLLQATKALIFAEKKGIVHRDVKPDNLMLTSDGQTKLADLGLAKKTDEAKGSTEDGIFGTPHFISPEQAQGKEVDHRADLYSLGATAYRILAGRTPFLGANVGEIIQKQIAEDPPPLRQFAPEAPEELIAVVARLMKKRVEDRYPSAEALFDDLEQIRLKYHLKLHGGGGGKGVLVAIALAFLAVVGVVVFALTRDGGSNGNGGSHTVYVPSTQRPAVGTADLTPDPEKVRQEKERAAQVAYLQAKVAEGALGDLAETALPKREAWRDLAASYEEVARGHPGTTNGGLAGSRAQEIRKEVTRQEEARARERDKAEAAWLGLKSRVNQLLDEGKLAEAWRVAESEGRRPDVKAALDAIPGARGEYENWLGEGASSIRARFAAAFNAAKEEFERLRGEGSYVESSAALAGFLERAVGAEKRDPFGPAAAEAAKLRTELGEEYEQVLRSQVANDGGIYYRTWRAARHREGVAGDYADNLVYDFRYEEAAQRFDALLDESEDALGTEPFRDRAKAAARRLRGAGRLLALTIEHIASGKIEVKDLNFPPGLSGGSNVVLKLNEEDGPAATADGLSVSKRIGVGGGVAFSKEVIPWSKFSPQEFWDYLLLGGRRFPMTPEEHAAAALFMAVAGLRTALDAEISAAGSALDPDDLKWARRELEAMNAYDALVLAENGTPPISPEDRIRAMTAFQENHCDSDFFILVYGYPEPWQRLLPAKTVDDWVAARLAVLK